MIWNLPNILTLLRIPLLFAIIWLGEVDWEYRFVLIVTLLMASMITDFLDGYLARKLNLVSDFGKVADPLFDKLFILGLFIWMLAIDLIPAWNVSIVLLLLLRELAVTGLRGGGTTGGKTFGADGFGKWKTTLLFASLWVLLLAEMLRVDFGMSGAWLETLYWAGVTLLWVGSALGIYSGIRYFRLHA